MQSLQKAVKSLKFERGNLEVDKYLENLPDKSEEELFSLDNQLREDEVKYSFVSVTVKIEIFLSWYNKF